MWTITSISNWQQGVFMRFWAIIISIISYGCLSITMGFQPPKTTEYSLDNGLKVLLQEDHRSPVVLLSLWYKVGGSYEPNGSTGISHILEHMMFKGTDQHPDGEFKSLIANTGGDQNAMTSPDFTMYYETLPADKLKLGLTLEADRMQHLNFSTNAFNNEHNVVKEERLMRYDDNPQSLTWLRFRSIAFINNPYHQPVIGWHDDIQHYTKQALMDWYKTWYTPNNAEIIIVGDFDTKETLHMIQQRFSAIPPKATPPIQKHKQLTNLGSRSIAVTKPAKLPWIITGYNVPSLSTLALKDQWKAYALYTASAILSIDDSSRLPKHLIRDQKIAASADSNYSLYRLYDGLWTIDAVPAPKHTLEQCQQSITEEINSLKTTLVTDDELKRIKAHVIAYDVYKNDNLFERVMNLGVPEMSNNSWRDLVEFSNHIKQVTPQQIRQVAQEYFIDQNQTTATLIPSQPSDHGARSA